MKCHELPCNHLIEHTHFWSIISMHRLDWARTCAPGWPQRLNTPTNVSSVLGLQINLNFSPWCFVYLFSVSCTLYIILHFLLCTFRVYQPEVQTGSVISVITSDFHSYSNNFFLGWQQSLVLWFIGFNKIIAWYGKAIHLLEKFLLVHYVNKIIFIHFQYERILDYSRILISKINTLGSVGLQPWLFEEI